MPRQARIDAPGALHHIIIRGIERRKIFQDDADRENFLQRLGDTLTESSTPCYGWALMPNHAHLLLRTGVVPIATVMRRLLTGYAVSYNRRHRRHGQLFQNRYKSILCQEDPYLLELVRYVHLNPLRGQIISDLKGLDVYVYTGHSYILGRRENSWQDINYILGLFDRKVALARRRYRAFVQEGIGQGRKPDLVGGGLIRSLGGWDKVKRLRGDVRRVKGDERILGDSDFVMEVLEACGERFDRRYQLRSQGYDLERIGLKVASLFEIDLEEIYVPGKRRRLVQARSLYCYWTVRELGLSASRQ
jgi:REP element-mobilizing transposase RayT